MYLDESFFGLQNIDCHSALIELVPEFAYPTPSILWLEVGTKSIGLPPSALSDATNNGTGNTSSSVDDDNALTWRRYDRISPKKRKLRLKNLQPNYHYFVRVAIVDSASGSLDDTAGPGPESRDLVKSFWTEDWPDDDKKEAVVLQDVDFGKFYSLGRRLGRGHFGDVNLCAEKPDAATSTPATAPKPVPENRIYAAKIMKVTRRQQIEAAQNEVAILRELRHENVVWLKQAIWAPRATLYLVME